MTARACTNCGTPLPEEARFCGACGTPNAPVATRPQVPVVGPIAPAPRGAPAVTARKRTMIDGSAHVPHRPPRQAPIPASAAPSTLPEQEIPTAPTAPRVDLSKTIAEPSPGAISPDLMRTQIDVSPFATSGLGVTMADPNAQANARELMASTLANLDDWESASEGPTQVARAVEEDVPATQPDPEPPRPAAPVPSPARPAAAAQASPAPAAAPPAPAPQPAPATASEGAISIPSAWVTLEKSPLSRSVASPESFGASPPAAPAPLTAGPPQPGPNQPAAPVRAPTFASAKRTMMGVTPGELEAVARPPEAPPSEAQPPRTHPSRDTRLGAQRTMMGVVAPPAQPPAQVPGNAPPNAAMQDPRAQGASRTMLGVAMPGIAPTAAGQSRSAERPYKPPQYAIAAPLPQVVPPPSPLVDDDEPVQIPMWRPKAGVPIVAVVGLVMVLLLIGGVIIGVGLFRKTTLTAAQPRLDERGGEVLVVTCASCPDGTILSIGQSKATVSAHEATVPLSTPLAIGDNQLAVRVERAGSSPEEVRITVPIAYRIRADLSTLAAKPPVVTVRVEATLGTSIVVDGKVLTMDASGKGSYPVDVSEDTVGAADEPKVLDRKIPFTITPKGARTENGVVFARAPVVPLHVDAPLATTVVTDAAFVVAGSTIAGGKVTLDGHAIPVDAKGVFLHSEPLLKTGESQIELAAHIDNQAPRSVKLKIRRVASLEVAAREADAQSPLSYTAFATDASKVGQLAVIEGEIMDIRATPGQSVYLVANRPGCAKDAECLVRVLEAGEAKLEKGASVRVYGQISKPVTSGGRLVPELLASFHLPAPARQP